MDIAIGARDQHTGRFNFVRDQITNDVAFDQTEAHAVMTSALEDLGGYWADPNHGSELFRLENLSQKTPSLAEAMVGASLDSLERQGRIAAIAVEAEASQNSSGLGRLEVNLRWTGVNGSNQQTAEI